MTDFKELEDYPDFYSIPGYPDYGITKSGVLFNVVRDSFLAGGKNPAGYHNYRITNPNGVTTTWGRHRLMAFVFKHPGVPIDDLVVNHKNGIKGDDWLDNLEWVTQIDNIEHAGEIGINSKCRPINVRDVYTGEVIYFPSFIKCARYYGVTKDTIAWRMKFVDERVFPEGRQYRCAQVNGPWNDVDYVGPVGKDKPVLVRFLDTGIIVQYNSQRHAARSLKLSEAALSVWLNYNDGLPVRYGFIQVKYLNDPQQWRTPLKPFTEYYDATNQRAVGVRDHNNGGCIVIYLSGSACCKELNIKPTLLNYRLKSKGQKVYQDGRSFFYLDEYESCPIEQQCSIDLSLIARTSR